MDKCTIMCVKNAIYQKSPEALLATELRGKYFIESDINTADGRHPALPAPAALRQPLHGRPQGPS